MNNKEKFGIVLMFCGIYLRVVLDWDYVIGFIIPIIVFVVGVLLFGINHEGENEDE